MKVIGKRPKPTIQVRSCMVCTFLMPLLWERKDVMNALGESGTAIIQSCLAGGPFLQHYCDWDGSLHSVNLDGINYQRGGM